MKPSSLVTRHSSLRHTVAFYTEAPDAPRPRNFTKEMEQTLAGYQRTAPGYYALESQYQPLYGELALRNRALGLYGSDDTPGELEMGRYATQFNRAGDIADVMQYGPAVTAAQLRANPFLTIGLEQLHGRMSDSPILSLLNQQAKTGLESGGQLTPAEVREATQASRSGFADRGMAMGNQSLAAEILGRDALVRQRQGAAQQFAQGVQGLNQAQNDFVGRGTQISATALADPFSVLLGRAGGAYGGGSSSGGGQMIGAGATRFDPTNPYAADIYNSNFNAEASHNIAQANANNANMQTYATIAAALLSDERIKTDKHKTGRKTPEGIDEYEYRYKTDPEKRRFVGVMAQDVEKVRPDAVVTDPLSGLKAVRYGALAPVFREVLEAAA